MDKERTLWIRAVNYGLNLDYYGVSVLIEDFQRTPHIILSNYIKRDLNGNIIEDCFLNPEKRVIIDTDKFDVIELIYHKDSNNIKEIRNKINMKDNK